MTDRLPPHSLDAERSVLGACMVENANLPRTREILDASDFYRSAHRLLFDAMTKLRERSIAIDPVTLKEEMERRGSLAEVGGPAYITGLLDGVPHSSNVEHYARIVKEKATYRGLGEAGTDLVDASYSGNGAVHGALDRIRRAAEALAPGVALPDLADLLTAPETPAPICIATLHEFGSAQLASGPAGSWKTTTAAAQALSVASGQPFAGQLEARQAPVLHIDAEMGERRLVNLYRRLGHGEGIDAADLARRGFLSYLPATGSGPGRDPRTWERIVRERLIGFVVLDSIVALYGGDENDPTAVRRWWECSVRPLLDLGAAVFALHHDRKGSAMIPDSPITSTRGSGDWRGAPDVHAGIRCEPGDHHLVRYEVTKSRIGPEPDPFHLRIESAGDRLRVRWAGEAQETVGKTVEASIAIETMLEAAGAAGMLRQQILEALKSKYATRTLEDALSLVKSHVGVTRTSEHGKMRYRKALA